METLRIPPTIRALKRNECPSWLDYDAYIRERETMKIMEGYRLLPSTDPLFGFFAEISIDYERLFDLFKALTLLIPHEYVGLIAGFKDAAPHFLPYLDKFAYLNMLQPLAEHLTTDGYLEFGLIHRQEDFLCEVFVKSFKYTQFWGSDEQAFRQTMQAFDLHEVPDLAFADSQAVMTQARHLHFPDSQSTEEIIEYLIAQAKAAEA